jgi:hypothetical protein
VNAQSFYERVEDKRKKAYFAKKNKRDAEAEIAIEELR